MRAVGGGAVRGQRGGRGAGDDGGERGVLAAAVRGLISALSP